MKIKMNKLLISAMLVASVGLSTVALASSEADAYNKAVAAVNAAADKAKSVDGEWRDIRWKKSKFVKYTDASGKKHKASFVKAAELAAKDGNYSKAMSLLDMALFQAKRGYAQAMEQKNAGPRF